MPRAKGSPNIALKWVLLRKDENDTWSEVDRFSTLKQIASYVDVGYSHVRGVVNKHFPTPLKMRDFRVFRLCDNCGKYDPPVIEERIHSARVCESCITTLREMLREKWHAAPTLRTLQTRLSV